MSYHSAQKKYKTAGPRPASSEVIVAQLIRDVEWSIVCGRGDSSLVHEHCVLTLGEVGKFVDLSVVAGMGDIFLSQLRSQNDEIRTAGALALGYALAIDSADSALRCSSPD